MLDDGVQSAMTPGITPPRMLYAECSTELEYQRTVDNLERLEVIIIDCTKVE